MATQDRTVRVIENEAPVQYYNKKGERKDLGRIVLQDYQGEVKRFLFNPTSANPWSNRSKQTEAYQIGVGSKSLTFINPADAMQVLLDSGWQIADQYAMKGGLTMHTTFIMNDRAFQDPIGWDLDLWSNRKEIDRMFPAIRLETNLQLGRVAARYAAGILRLICTNGMVGRVLGLAELEYNHSNWDMLQAAGDVAFMGADDINQFVLGPAVGSVGSLSRSMNLLRQYNEELHSPEGLSERFKLLETHLNTLSPNMVKPWALTGYIHHMQSFIDAHSSEDQVHVGHLMNAYTSAVNQHRDKNSTDRGAMASFAMTDAVVQTTTTLTALAALFSTN